MAAIAPYQCSRLHYPSADYARLEVSSDYVQSVCSSIMVLASSFILSNTFGSNLRVHCAVCRRTHVYIVSHHFRFWQYRIVLLQG